nr:hypothetical protein [Burkholderia contaminans]
MRRVIIGDCAVADGAHSRRYALQLLQVDRVGGVCAGGYALDLARARSSADVERDAAGAGADRNRAGAGAAGLLHQPDSPDRKTGREG